VPDEGLLPDVAARGKARQARSVSGATCTSSRQSVEDGDVSSSLAGRPACTWPDCGSFPAASGAGESHAQALRREMQEELDTDVEVGALCHRAHAYDDRHVTLHFYACQLEDTPRPLLGQEMRWVPADDLRSLGFPPPTKS
jgi:8-oxo-dGTP pyrophosphatase MutT (NUDIX family)